MNNMNYMNPWLHSNHRWCTHALLLALFQDYTLSFHVFSCLFVFPGSFARPSEMIPSSMISQHCSQVLRLLRSKWNVKEMEKLSLSWFWCVLMSKSIGDTLVLDSQGMRLLAPQRSSLRCCWRVRLETQRLVFDREASHLTWFDHQSVQLQTCLRFP